MSALSPLILKFLDLYKRDAGLAAGAVENAYKELSDSLEEYPEDEGCFKESDVETRRLLKARILEDPKGLEQKLKEIQQQSIIPAQCGRDWHGNPVIRSTYENPDFAEIFAEGLAFAEEDEESVEDYKAQAEEERVQRMSKPDVEVELLRHFLADLDKRVDSFQKLEDLDLERVPQHLQRPFNEACHCYLNGQRLACLALCAAIVEDLLRKPGDRKTNYERVLAAKEQHLSDDEGEKALSICNLRNSALHSLPAFEGALQKRKSEMTKMGLVKVTDDDVWMQCLFDTRHLMKTFLRTQDLS